eukprot:m.31353 g.31353  ORF g.31353 m.31353 type:complete len:56 (+) comp9414_c0_seq1:160-327(+)
MLLVITETQRPVKVKMHAEIMQGQERYGSQLAECTTQDVDKASMHANTHEHIRTS